MLAVAVLAAPQVVRADIGVGVFIGEPTGLDLKIGLERRTALDIVIGWDRLNDNRADYAHATFLANLATLGNRRSNLRVPIRLGVGAAVYDAGDLADEINVAVRAPLELALYFRKSSLEVYGEIALRLTLVDDNDNNDDVQGDGGIGLRVYF